MNFDVKIYQERRKFIDQRILGDKKKKKKKNSFNEKNLNKKDFLRHILYSTNCQVIFIFPSFT